MPRPRKRGNSSLARVDELQNQLARGFAAPAVSILLRIERNAISTLNRTLHNDHDVS
jgi:hypothetical protein